jgi:hypothetical protein
MRENTREEKQKLSEMFKVICMQPINIPKYSRKPYLYVKIRQQKFISEEQQSEHTKSHLTNSTLKSREVVRDTLVNKRPHLNNKLVLFSHKRLKGIHKVEDENLQKPRIFLTRASQCPVRATIMGKDSQFGEMRCYPIAKHMRKRSTNMKNTQRV